MKYQIKTRPRRVASGRDPWVVMQRIIDVIPEEEKGIEPLLEKIERSLQGFWYQHPKDGIVKYRWQDLGESLGKHFANRDEPWITTIKNIFMDKEQ